MAEPEPGDNGLDVVAKEEATGEGMPEPPPSLEAAQPQPPPQLPSPFPPPLTPPAIADDTLRHLDPNYVELSRVIGMIVTAAIGAANLIGGILVPALAGAPLWSLVLTALAGAGITVLIGIALHRWPAVEHTYHSYRVNTRGIEIRDGVWFRSVVNVARSRIQHTDVSQGPLERRYGLAKLHIHTAGTEQAEVRLPGLAHETALAIRDYLMTGGEDDAV